MISPDCYLSIPHFVYDPSISKLYVPFCYACAPISPNKNALRYCMVTQYYTFGVRYDGTVPGMIVFLYGIVSKLVGVYVLGIGQTLLQNVETNMYFVSDKQQRFS